MKHIEADGYSIEITQDGEEFVGIATFASDGRQIEQRDTSLDCLRLRIMQIGQLGVTVDDLNVKLGIERPSNANPSFDTWPGQRLYSGMKI